MRTKLLDINSAILLLIIFLFVSNGCNINGKCLSIDNKFKSKFDHHILALKNLNNGDSLINSDSLLNTIRYLVFVTGIESNVYVGEVVGYNTRREFEDDARKWQKWYNNNKCNITLEDADSIFILKNCEFIKNDSLRKVFNCP